MQFGIAMLIQCLLAPRQRKWFVARRPILVWSHLMPCGFFPPLNELSIMSCFSLLSSDNVNPDGLRANLAVALLIRVQWHFSELDAAVSSVQAWTQTFDSNCCKFAIQLFLLAHFFCMTWMHHGNCFSVSALESTLTLAVAHFAALEHGSFVFSMTAQPKKNWWRCTSWMFHHPTVWQCNVWCLMWTTFIHSSCGFVWECSVCFSCTHFFLQLEKSPFCLESILPFCIWWLEHAVGNAQSAWRIFCIQIVNFHSCVDQIICCNGMPWFLQVNNCHGSPCADSFWSKPKGRLEVALRIS